MVSVIDLTLSDSFGLPLTVAEYASGWCRTDANGAAYLLPAESRDTLRGPRISSNAPEDMSMSIISIRVHHSASHRF